MNINRFLADKTLFLTGVTGFVGKVLLEKILRQAPEVQRIYCLVRSKKNVAPEVRLQEILDSELFWSTKKTKPAVFDKIQPVVGDISEEWFGMDEATRRNLQDNVNVIFHIAANVKFVQTIKEATQANVRGTRTMLDLAKSTADLHAYVHMSTCYCNPDQNRPGEEIMEQVYKSNVPPNEMLRATQWLDEDAVEAMRPWLLKNMNNPYAFTKRLGENILATEGHGMPIAIVRPSIITSSWREPFPGWIDNLLAIGSCCAETVQGRLRVVNFRPDAIADIIPVDLVANATLASAWYTSIQPSHDAPRVYHFASSTNNPCTWRYLFDTGYSWCRNYPRMTLLPRTQPKVIKEKLPFTVNHLFFHMLPAFIADVFRVLTFRRPKLVGSYNRMVQRQLGLAKYLRQTFLFSTTNLMEMWNGMSKVDKEIYPFDPRLVEWSPYLVNYFKGITHYILKYKGAKPSLGSDAQVTDTPDTADAQAAPSGADTGAKDILRDPTI